MYIHICIRTSCVCMEGVWGAQIDLRRAFSRGGDRAALSRHRVRTRIPAIPTWLVGLAVIRNHDSNILIFNNPPPGRECLREKETALYPMPFSARPSIRPPPSRRASRPAEPTYLRTATTTTRRDVPARAPRANPFASRPISKNAGRTLKAEPPVMYGGSTCAANHARRFVGR